MNKDQRDKLSIALKNFCDEAESMTKEQAHAWLAKAAIINEDGSLRPEYGGPGYKEWLEQHPNSYTHGPKIR